MHVQEVGRVGAERQAVIALHCSGAGAGQWRQLGEALDPRHTLIAPEHYGCESVGAWSGARAFTLADEAAVTVDLIDRADGKVHLVGHSYGGGVALRAAIERPDRIASLTLYEPSAFHLLNTVGARGAAAFAEITALRARIDQGVITGDYLGAASSFVDYWAGAGAWSALRPAVQATLTRWIPKASLDFRALIEEPTPASAYGDLLFPTLIMRGEHALAPSRLIAEILETLLPDADLMVVAGAGHMGPLTHAAQVNAVITRHIEQSEVESGHTSTIVSPNRGRVASSYRAEVTA
jgi:pimeloyl-ACP methyl ester carboxylesterase